MQVRLLGPVDVAAEGSAIEVAGVRRRALLAALALQAGDVVSTDRLREVVWGERAGTVGLNTIQSHVSALRRVLGVKSAIVARPPGYVLDLPGDPTDAAAAERLLGEARRSPEPARRAALLRAGLDLWRGEPLQDLLDVPWLTEQSGRLAGLEVEIRRTLIDARLALGEHVHLLPELGDLAARHPFDEEVRGQLVLALYRAGRQADALAVLRDVRRLLAAELGIDPGPTLRALEARVLQQDPLLAAPATPVAAVAGPTGGAVRHGRRMVGRAAELTLLDDLLTAGTSPVIAVAGDPGIGKTLLLSELARRAEQAGRTVFWGRATEFEQQPFGIVRDALAEAAVPAHLPDGETALLREILPALPGPQVEAAVRGALVAERYRMHRAVRTLLEALAEPAGVLLVLDDLHWADDGSAELLDYLLRHPPRGRVLITAVYRPRQLSGRLRQALGRAMQDGVAHEVELGPLTAAEADELLPDGLDDARRRHLYQTSGGNPFYLQALSRTELPGEAVGAPRVEDALPSQVRAALMAEIDALTPVETLVAWAVAVLADGAEPELTAQTAELPVDDVLAALDALVQRDLLRPVLNTDRFEFRHPLLRRVTYDAARSGWRIGAHARAAAVLRQRGAPATEQAGHLERSALRGDQHAVAVLREAAASTMHSSPATTAHWLGTALRLVPDDATATPLRLELLSMRAQAQSFTGRLREGREDLHDVLDLLPGDATDMRVRLVGMSAGIERFLGNHAGAHALLHAELERLGTRRGLSAAILLNGLAGGYGLGTYEGTEDWPRIALVAARDAGDSLVLANALIACVVTDLMAGSVDSLTTGCLDEAVALVEAMPDAKLAQSLHVLVWIATAEISYERVRHARRHLDRALEVARERGQVYFIGQVHVMRATTYRMAGDLRAAAQCTEDARDAAALTPTNVLLAYALASQCATAGLSGDVDRAIRLGREAVAMAGPGRSLFASTAAGALATAHLQAGDAASCVDILAEEVGGPEPAAAHPITRATWYETLARAEAQLGRPDRAAEWADRAEAEVAIWSTPRRAGLAHLARAHALVAIDPARAAAHADRASETFASADDRLRIGRSQLAAGTALAAAGDPAGARARLAEARAVFEECGAELFLTQARQAAGALPPR